MPNLEIEAANAGLLPPTAAELVTDLENGDESAMLAKIEKLGRSDFTEVLKAVRRLDSALSAYALSWQNAECWGQGVPFPGEGA